jgi:hypothetical protein
MKQRTKILSTKVIKSKLRHFISKRQKPNLSFELREYENTQDIPVGSVPYQFRKKVSFSEAKAENKKSPISRLQRKLSKSRISKSQRNILKESDISISDYEKPFFSEIEGNSKKIYHEYNVEIMDPEEKEEMNEEDDALVDDDEINNSNVDQDPKNDASMNNEVKASHHLQVNRSSLNNNRNGGSHNVNNANNMIDVHQISDLNNSSSSSDLKKFSFELGSSSSSSSENGDDDQVNEEEFLYEIGEDDEEDDNGDDDIDDGGVPISSFDSIFATGDEKGDLKNHVNNLFLQAQQDFNLLSLSIPFGTELHDEGDGYNSSTNNGGIDQNNNTTIPMNLITADQYLSFPDSILLPALPPTPRDQNHDSGSQSTSNKSMFDQFLHSSPPTTNLPLEPTTISDTIDDHHHNLSLHIGNHEYSLNLPPLPQSPRSPRPSSFTSPSRQLLKAYSLGDSGSGSSGSSPVTPPATTSRRRRGSESRNKDEVVVFLDELVSGISSPPTSPQSLRFRRRSCSSNATSNTRSSSTPIFDSTSSDVSSPPVGRGAIALSSSPLHCSSSTSLRDRSVNRHHTNDDIVVEDEGLSSQKINISKSSSSSSSSSDDSCFEVKNNNHNVHHQNNNGNDNGDYNNNNIKIQKEHNQSNNNRRMKKIEYQEIENDKEYLSRDEYNQFIDSLLGQTDDLVSSIDMKEFYDVEEEMEEDVIIHDGAFTSDHMVVIYKDGSRYEGGIKENKWFGKGKCFFSDGSIYEGDVLDDQIHGIGTLVYQNGDEYIGEWCKDLRHGWGRYLSSNGDVYEGDFVDDKQHGMGVFVANNGSKYVGEFKFGLPDGKGGMFQIFYSLRHSIHHLCLILDHHHHHHRNYHCHLIAR